MTTETARYRVGESLGKGGMGEVFLADDTQLVRKVAIKFLAEALEADETARERLQREARSAAALDHPYICKIHELVVIGGRRGIVMEHVTGETLQARLRRAPLSPKEALEIAGEVAEALEAAHKRRVVHRDLKPSNVMLTDEGHVKVMDFGLAKQVHVETPSDEQSTGSLTDPGVRVGTPGYMAPEQLLGGQVDERSDLFAFGVLLYELLAGVHPFTRASPSGTMAAILKETPAPISQYAKDAPESARVALDRLLAKEPHQRYQSFGDLRIDIGQLLHDASGLTPVRQAADSVPTATDGRTPFIGRESERAEARRLLERAIEGQGGVLLLGGEPGVGKTRLAEEVLAEGRERGCLALAGRCYETEGTPPFIPWVEMVEHSAAIVPKAAFRDVLGDAAPEVAKLVPELRRTFPDIPAPIELPPEQQRRYLFNSFLDFVKRASQSTPQVMLVDDLHWADDSTLLLLQHVAQHAREIPLLIVGTYRDVDLEVARPFAKTLEALTRQRLAHKVSLRRLSNDGVGGMLRALSRQEPPEDLVATIYTETEGNPFFVEEVFQHLSEEGRLFDESNRWRTDLRVTDLEVPEGVRLVIGRRMERLSPDARRILTTAAVVGRSFDLALLEALGDAEGDALVTALEAAEAAKLIQTLSSTREARWEFAHGLIRQTLESSLSLVRRQRAHLRVAEAMEGLYAADVDRRAPDLGHHLYQAGAGAPPDKTARFLTLAGDQAQDAEAFEEALRRFDQALSVLESDDPVDTARLREKKGHALRSLGRISEAVEEWQRALDTFIEAHDDAAILRTAAPAWNAQAWGADSSAALATAQRGLDALQTKTSRERCLLLALAAASLSFDGRPGGATMIDEAASMVDDFGDDRLSAEVLHQKTWHHWYWMQVGEACVTGERAIELHRAGSRLWFLAEMLAVPFSCAAFCTGRLDDVVASGAEAVRLSDRSGHLGARIFGRSFPSLAEAVRTADLKVFEQRATELTELGRQTDFPYRAFTLRDLGLARVWRGEWAEAEAALREAVELEPRVGFMTCTMSSCLLDLHVLTGDAAAAQQLMRHRDELSRAGSELTNGRWDLLQVVVRGLATLDLPHDAAPLHALILKGIDNGLVLSQRCDLWQTVAGVAAASAKIWDASQHHFETALRQAETLPHKIGAPEARRWYTKMLHDRNQAGDLDKARTLLGEALAMYEQIGMPRHVEMAKDALKDL